MHVHKELSQLIPKVLLDFLIIFDYEGIVAGENDSSTNYNMSEQ